MHQASLPHVRLNLQGKPTAKEATLKRRAVVPALLVALIAGCVSLTPEAEKMKVTKKAADVVGCKALGYVEGHPPYVGPRDGMHQMQNQASALGADTLFVTAYNVSANGVAYLCGKSPAPTPNPPPQ